MQEKTNLMRVSLDAVFSRSIGKVLDRVDQGFLLSKEKAVKRLFVAELISLVDTSLRSRMVLVQRC